MVLGSRARSRSTLDIVRHEDKRTVSRCLLKAVSPLHLVPFLGHLFFDLVAEPETPAVQLAFIKQGWFVYHNHIHCLFHYHHVYPAVQVDGGVVGRIGGACGG